MKSVASRESLTRYDSLDFYDPNSDHLKEDQTSVSTDEDVPALPSATEELIPEHVLLEQALLEETKEFRDAIDDHETSWYGQPLTPQQAEQITFEGGLIWRSEVVPNIWWNPQNNKLINGLTNPRDFDVSQRAVKMWRKTLALTQSDLLSSLTRTPSGRYIFHGSLNGWPSLSALELISLERKRGLLPLAQFQPVWRKNGYTPQELPALDPSGIYRATWQGPSWTRRGWSEDSPGFVWWYQQLPSSICFGTDCLENTSATDRISYVHMVSHRYAIKQESPKDKLTYHSIVLLEWEHGQYVTVVEGAYLNGITGYKFKSNWFHDRDETPNVLSKCFPDAMIGPWITTGLEIRAYDVPHSRNLDEFWDFIQQYKGADGRFLDPQVSFSHVARLTYRTKRDIAQYLLNYIGRDTSYQELRQNCQTFAADLCAFLAGKKHVEPFHPTMKLQYRNRTYQFLYDSFMYQDKTVKKR
jgi:hypothetical protein